jgi:hypothetical protein
MGAKEAGGPITIGYHYYMSMHMVICQGPVDTILEIMSYDNLQISNQSISQAGTLYINQPGLFGGVTKSGGVIGNVIFLPNGIPDSHTGASPTLPTPSAISTTDVNGIQGTSTTAIQTPSSSQDPILYAMTNAAGLMFSFNPNNDLKYRLAEIFSGTNMSGYSLDVISALFNESVSTSFTPAQMPSFKGVASVVWDDLLYQSNISRPQAWKFKVQRIPFQTVAVPAIYTFPNVDATYSNIVQHAESLVTPYGITGGIDHSFVKDKLGNYYIDGVQVFPRAFTSDSQGIKVFTLGNASNSASTHWYAATSADLAAYGFGYDWSQAGYYYGVATGGNAVIAVLDPSYSAGLVAALLTCKTAQPGELYPTTTSNTALTQTLSINEANPAYVILECLIDPVWGLGYTDISTFIDLDSFNAAAATLYNENFGISALWQNESTVQDFVTTILGVINGVLYI